MIDIVNGNFDKAVRDLNRSLQLNGVPSEVKFRSHHRTECQKRALKRTQREATIRKHSSKAGSRKSPAKYPLSIFNPNLV